MATIIAVNNFRSLVGIFNQRTTPITMYRGEYGQKQVASDIFSAYTPDRKIAEKFGDKITEIKIRPIDTWGSYQTIAEQEFLVPRHKIKK